LPHLSLRIRAREKRPFEEGAFANAILNAFDTLARPIARELCAEAGVVNHTAQIDALSSKSFLFFHCDGNIADSYGGQVG
jgi:hypothetical protein